ncbi:hypothetical protein BAX97_04420 [Elizabethkingia meningoseptica]|uniref:MepB family protein n=1 Tax=Elizabethkingia meningoseptica TaxID=238 RepID=UPI000332CA01|nr:MepB family protein [Elizabethkingia meningoseptica]AQX06838.1 hypothetical protein BBD33_16910 [Elizabethkingia meningoseptica]AQX48884.1 hypothetical protein B5G46_16895 [Elizabethkingia meningoseptica]EOR28930.1 hypothetical protein L100_13714 [Elizabethkingia meningoseptica ATCC 13253 = NBRC 12535]KUY14970.1 hypothetical protein ATB99_10720 [Elizabethkingia meningoseptica]MDE5488416.1 MepB family protein [Elizabethkingia meningoseptica]
MVHELQNLEDSILKNIEFSISDVIPDAECEEYSGYNFKLHHLNIKFRKAKVTPKKNGLFVTLWKRNPDGNTEAFHYTDSFDFYIIAAGHHNRQGYFIFPANVLANKQILTTETKEGKRGFRVYPDWDTPQSTQAEKTQKWQSEYFININTGKDQITENLAKFLAYE